MHLQTLPLAIHRAEAYADALARAERGPFAFIGLPASAERLPGIEGALGLAVANERGYTPVPLAWARFTSLAEAEGQAEKLNRELLNLTPRDELGIVASTMGGRRYNRAAA
jgi:hypothetical protein